MFDGIEAVALLLHDLAPAHELYVEHLGFTVVSDRGPTPGLDAVLGLTAHDSGCTRVVQLAKPGAEGGGLLLVQTPGAPRPVPAGAPRTVGPYALDFYLRDPDPVEDGLARAGWGFTSDPVHYALPGTTIPVRERMLRQDDAGLLHALVQHRPRGTRSVVGTDETQHASEVVALVCLTPDLDDARSFASDVLGAHEYFHGTFDGPAVETMLDLPAGTGLEAALFRGPRSRNARLEFARPTGLELGETSATHRVVALVHTGRLDELAAELADGRHGAAGPITDLDLGDGPTRGFHLASAYGLALAFVEPPC